MTRKALLAALSAMLAVCVARAGGSGLVSDLSITNTDYASHYTPGSATLYTIVVTNAGPDAVVGATVTDPAPSSPQVSAATWTCLASGGGKCTAGPINGAMNDTIDLPVGASVTYTLATNLSSAATGNLVNTATVTPPAGTTDPGPAPNSATDTDLEAPLMYVSPDGTDSAACGTLSAPCKTIQAAIDKAAAGTTVVVHAGTYKECIVLVPGIGLGGVRVESDEHLASGGIASTILDGTGVCDAASAAPGPVAKVYDGSSLRGFTIQGGGDSGVWGLGAVSIANNVILGNTTASNGGGVRLITGANLSDPVSKAEIRLNSIHTNTAGRSGAGIYVEASASGLPSLVDIKANTVQANTAGDGSVAATGAGVAVFTGTASASDVSTVVINGNTLDGNVAKNATGGLTLADGGGLYVGTGAFGGAGTETVTLGVTGLGNGVRNNVSEGLGGGMSIGLTPGPGGKHTVDVASSTVSANKAGRGGGGAHFFAHAIDRTAGASPDTVLRVSGNSFTGNHAQGSLSDPNAPGGGGMYAELHSDRTAAGAVIFEISGNTLQSNDGSPYGGGASLLASADDDPASDAVTAPAEAVISFHNNLVAANAAHDTTALGVSGGGVHALAKARGGTASARIDHDFLTVANNQTELGSGGLEWEDLHLPNSIATSGTTAFTLSNSIVSGNDGYGVGGTIIPSLATTVAVSYTDAYGNGSADYESQLGVSAGTNGNISVDPLLDALFLPRPCGPTIDAGDPALSATNEPAPNGGRVNLGHLGDTASAVRTFPDVNGDGTIDGLDILGIAVSFGSVSPDPRYFSAADRDHNGTVDGSDLAYVSAFYAQTCP